MIWKKHFPAAPTPDHPPIITNLWPFDQEQYWSPRQGISFSCLIGVASCPKKSLCSYWARFWPWALRSHSATAIGAGTHLRLVVLRCMRRPFFAAAPGVPRDGRHFITTLRRQRLRRIAWGRRICPVPMRGEAMFMILILALGRAAAGSMAIMAGDLVGGGRLARIGTSLMRPYIPIPIFTRLSGIRSAGGIGAMRRRTTILMSPIAKCLGKA